MRFSHLLRCKRREFKLTQAQLAERLSVCESVVMCWETGRSTPTTANLLKLCKTFGCEAEELIDNADWNPKYIKAAIRHRINRMSTRQLREALLAIKEVEDGTYSKETRESA